MGKKKPDVPEKNMNLRLPIHVWEGITSQSQKDGRSMNASIVQCIIDYLHSKGYDMDRLHDYTKYPEMKLNKDHDCKKKDSSEAAV